MGPTVLALSSRVKVIALVVVHLVWNLIISFSTAAIVPSQEGFVSIDLGGETSVDPVTGIHWTNSFEKYLQAVEQLTKEGVITKANVTLNVSTPVDNAQQLKTALIFVPMPRDSSHTQRSKFCFNFPVEYKGQGVNYVLRAMFPSSNLTAKDAEGNHIPVDAYSKRFYFSVDSTYVATVELDPNFPKTIELIISSLDRTLYVCLVPLEDGSSMPAISTLELRPVHVHVDDSRYTRNHVRIRGTTYTRGIAMPSSYLITVSRQNFGGELILPPYSSSGSLRFPHDPFDRLWSTPQLTDPRVRSVENNTFFDLTSDVGSDFVQAPTEVIRTAWEARDVNDTITFKWELGDSRRPERQISQFYWRVLVRDTFQRRLGNHTRAVSMNMRLAKEYLPVFLPESGGIITLFGEAWTFAENIISVTLTSNGSSDLPPLVNMAELLGELNAVVDRTVRSDITAAEDLARMVSDGLYLLDSSGDPCLPISWDWLVCSMEMPPRVTQINVTSKGVKGNLSDRFSGLDRLTVLDLSFNNLGPSADHLKLLGNLSSLRDLRLDSNGLQGRVPAWKPLSLGNLQRLSMSNNSLSGGISSLFQAMDATMSNLNLSRNNLNGYIPFEIIEAKLKGLQSLDLSHNNFSGNVTLTSQLTILQTLILNTNQLEGTVPSSIWDIGNVRLEFVGLQENHFTNVNLSTWYKSISDPRTKSVSSKLKVNLTSNRIESIYPDPESMQVRIKDLDQNAFILLGGNPWCTKHKGSSKVVVRYLCRFDETQDYLKFPDHSISKKILIAIILPFALLVAGMLCMLTYTLWKIRRRAVELRKVQEALTKEQVKPRFYDYDELKAATNSFSSKNILGKGGFGTVYKAQMMDGSILAVKRLNPTEQNISDFVKEIVNISGIKHRHLIQLKGCCVRDKQQRMLVYEFAENRSLAEALGPGKPFVLSWQQRFNVCLGIARGLAYLNEELQPKMIHRDIKPQNILLDKDYNAKIADFGLVRPSKVDHTSVTITIGGTKGYVPPEYVSEGLVSEKLDVYSLGIVLLEIVSGRSWVDLELPTEQIFLRNWAVTLFDEGKLLDLVDKELNGDYNEEEVLRVLHTAIACCQMDSKKRPTMSQVVNVLMRHANLAIDIIQELRGEKPHFRLEDIWEEDQDVLADEINEDDAEDQAVISSRFDSPVLVGG